MGIIIKCSKCGFELLRLEDGGASIEYELKKNYTIVRGGRKTVRCPRCYHEIDVGNIKKIVVYGKATKRDIIKSGRNITRLKRLVKRRKRRKLGVIDVEKWGEK